MPIATTSFTSGAAFLTASSTPAFKVIIDIEIPLEAVNFKTYNVMNQMAPFGPQNMSPVFGTKNVMIDSPPKLIKDQHLKGFLRAQDGKQKFEFIGFGMADKAELLEVDKPFDIAYHLEENNYLGNRTLVLNLMDIKIDA